MSLARIVAAALTVLAVAAGGARAASDRCGGLDAPCSVPLGEYYILTPEPAQGGPAPGAVVFLHGSGGSGAGTIRNGGMARTFLDRGYAYIAPTGLAPPDHRGGGWSFVPGHATGRDDIAFLGQVADDAARRFGLDRGRMLLSGFSVGGSMVWYARCAAPDQFAAYAPIAGAFWRPLPESCAGPARLLHTHGWADRTVPLEGRPLRGGAIWQGDVFAGLKVLREANGCDAMRADAFDTDGGFWRRVWSDCSSGADIELALHTGGHGIPPGWSTMALDWFERRPVAAPLSE